MINSNTITAISTSLGNSGINIIRISGEESFNIISGIFRKGKSRKTFNINETDTNTIHYGYIYDNDICIDEVLVTIFKAPGSYTSENVVEVNCHGGSYVTKKILMLIMSCGARHASPGEFTKRAFLNGRIDLTQAEAVMDIIKSENDYSLKSGINHLRGDIKDRISILRDRLLNNAAYIEAALDDPEHYSLEGYSDIIMESVSEVENELCKMESTYNNGIIVSEGIKTVIAGKPNVGKSSLMNYILYDDKAIVTNIPGTTRDILEYSVNIGMINIVLIDTAGIHETDDYIETIGIEKTFKYIEDADLIINVFDTSRKFDEEDNNLINVTKDKKIINVFNKCDKENVFISTIPDNIDLSCHIDMSTTKRFGYDKIVEKIEEMFYSNIIDEKNEFYITNVRHVELIKNAVISLRMVKEGITSGMSEDFLTIDIMDAYGYLGEIIGETVSDDLADRIFNEFCMGK